MRLKNAEDRALNAADVITLNIKRRNQGRQAEILTAARDGIDDVVRECFLSFRALGINERTFAADRDGLLYSTDTQLRVHGCNKSSCKFDPLAQYRGESRQRERDAIGTRS